MSSRANRSPRELRHDEAQRLEGLAGPQLEAALGERQWVARRPIGNLLFSSIFVVCPLLLALDGWGWVFTGRLLIADASSPPVVLGWAFTLLLTLLAVTVTAGWLGAWRREWIRLDADALTYRRPWYFRPRPPAVHPWDRCGPFTVREVPVSGGRSASLVEWSYDGQLFALGEEPFGDPRDLATILGAYRAVYGGAAAAVADPVERRARESPAALRRREATLLDRPLTEVTWYPSAARRYAELIAIAFCALCLGAFLGAWGSVPEGSPTWALLLASAAVFVGTGAYVVGALRNPPWVRLDPTGLTVAGARLLQPFARPRTYRWDECGPFALHVITGEVDRTVARSLVGSGRVTLEQEYGDPYDLVTILNAYRSRYGSG